MHSSARHKRSHHKQTYTLATFDIETDPFLFGRTPKPFQIGLFDGLIYKTFYGENCTRDFLGYLESRNDILLLYAHNGGRFDFYYLLSNLQNPFRIINGRIVAATIGKHRIRDSYAIIPVPLHATGAKRKIDYAHMETGERENHREEISAYLKQDCIALYELVKNFRDRFGDKLTIGSTAITELQKFHPIERLGGAHDELFRPFYFGGRVECFAQGIISGEWQVFDVNSMYPYVMANFNHPLGNDYEFTTNLQRALSGDAPFFAAIDATAINCFPVRGEVLFYPRTTARFMVTGYELRESLRLGLVDVHNVAGCWIAARYQTFAKYVAHWYAEKKQATATNDIPATIFAKLMLNSAYGKFGSNPENYYDYKLWREGEVFPGADWDLHLDYGDFLIMRAPARNRGKSYFDVAVAASITGAARAVLMRALATAENPLYCDTDSLICKRLNLPLSPALGDWKLEATADTAAIAGKKLYSLTLNGTEVKQAAKGVNLTSKEIFDIARGNTVVSQKDAPCFSLARPKGNFFIQRTLKGTV